MSVKGGVVDIQLMHVARLCLCSHTKLAWVPFGDGSHTLRPAGLYSPSKGKYYAVHAKNYSDFERILKFKHLLGADVKCCNFLVEKSDTKCLFLNSRYQRAVSVSVNSRENLLCGLVRLPPPYLVCGASFAAV